jgi:hypothetical protein
LNDSEEESETDTVEEFPEVAVLEFDEHAELQSKMWN